MAAKKLSEIAQGTPTSNDFVVGVTAANQDRLFSTTLLGKRPQQTGDTNYYVSTTGSDSNDGSSPTQVIGTLQGPWATLQHADNVITALDLNGFNATINIAAGSYVGVETVNAGYFSSVGTVHPASTACTVSYTGDTVTPSNVQITPTAKRQIGFGQFAPNIGADCAVSLHGLDFVESVDTAVWYDNFYVGTPAQGNVFMSNVQFDAAGSFVALVSGNVSFGNNITINGAGAGWVGAHCTGMMADGNESGLSASMFCSGTVTMVGNPHIRNGFLQIQASSCQMTGNFVGAYQGSPFQVAEHSRLVSPFVSWNSGNYGSPTLKAFIYDGGLFVLNEGVQSYEATGGFIIGTGVNYSQPATGFTLHIGQYDGIVIIDPAAGLATGTIVMPTPMLDTVRISIRSSQAITTLTITAGGSETLSNPPTTIAAGGIIDVYYNDNNTTWYF